MMVLAGADLVLPDRVVERGTLVIHDGRIAAIESRVVDGPAGATRVDLSGHTIVPGFIDVHVHGIEGIDVLDGGGAVAAIAQRLPKYGVTGFCPTSIACEPATLADLLTAVTAARLSPAPRSARVLPAHLESNFINPDWNGAQPRRCLRLPPDTARRGGNVVPPSVPPAGGADFSAGDILDVIARYGAATGIITLAPERQTESSWSAGSWTRGIVCRSATPAPRTMRRSPPSLPGRITPPTCSIACRR